MLFGIFNGFPCHFNVVFIDFAAFQVILGPFLSFLWLLVLFLCILAFVARLTNFFPILLTSFTPTNLLAGFYS